MSSAALAITPALHAQDWVRTGTNLGVQRIRLASASFKPLNNDSDTLPLKIYSMIKFGVTPEINALSTLMLGATLFLVMFFFTPSKSEA